MSGPLVIIGDALLDIDLEGRADRLTPDAPVPVLDDLVEKPRPGGAALAAAMAARDGLEVVLVTALGDDDAGRRVEQLLPDVRVHRLGYDGPTAVKKRVRAGGQSLLRLDSGTVPGTVADDVSGLAELLARASAVLVSDYGRGVTAMPGLRRLLRELPKRIPITWDPHPRGSEPVAGVRLLTPNAAEAATFAERFDAPAGSGLAAARRHADALVSGWQAQAVAVTLGARGALLSYGGGTPVVAPAPVVQSTDPCGAGDRFAVMAAAALGAGRLTAEAVQEAVDAAAAYVGAGGPASLMPAEPSLMPADPSLVPGEPSLVPGEPSLVSGEPSLGVVARVAAQGGTVVATGGCFDLLHAGHVATLRAARQLGDCLVVCLNSDDSVRRLKGPSRPLVPAGDRARVLEALECVDAVVVFDEDTPVEVLRRIRPHVWAKGGDYAGVDVPEGAVLEEWGGQAVALPYLKGRSTTDLVETAARRARHADH